MQTTPRDRIQAAVCTAILVALLGWALVVGLRVGLPRATVEPLALFDMPPAAAPRDAPVRPRRTHSRRPEGAAAPANLRSKASEVVAPVPLLPPPVPPVIVAASVAGTGLEASQGAAPVPGPGTGAGGIGTGTGSGGRGAGDGGGDDDTPPRRIAGRIKDSDYPRAAEDAGASGTVSVRYAVEVNGRVTGCVITRSSGNAALDETTCRLIEQRYRFRPGHDAAGRPFRSWIVADHDWIMERDPALQQ